MKKRGFTIVEAVIAMLIVAVTLVAALSTVAAARTSRSRIADRVRAQQLAQDLMAEILQQAYQDPVQTPVFGLEPGESATSRAAWNDVDDYNGWTESPPQSKSGNIFPDSTGWTRSVVVEWIDPTTLTVAAAPTGVKRITVNVQKGALTLAQIAAYRTLAWVDVIPSPTDATSNHPPTAAATASPLTGMHPLTVSFDGSGSSDSDGNSLSFIWSFGDGGSATGVQVSHSYSTAGTYNATLNVTDGRGGVGISTVTITVR